MDEYFCKTLNPRKPIVRDTSLGQASRELERQQIKIMRANRLFKTTQAYRSELDLKQKYF
jgi:hypothetical protein